MRIGGPERKVRGLVRRLGGPKEKKTVRGEKIEMGKSKVTKL